MELLIDKIIVKEAREGDHHQSSGLVLDVYWNFFIPTAYHKQVAVKLAQGPLIYI
ncbi:hypothetical protein [Alkaliphilus crotonatoxidans]